MYKNSSYHRTLEKSVSSWIKVLNYCRGGGCYSTGVFWDWSCGFPGWSQSQYGTEAVPSTPPSAATSHVLLHCTCVPPHRAQELQMLPTSESSTIKLWHLMWQSHKEESKRKLHFNIPSTGLTNKYSHKAHKKRKQRAKQETRVTGWVAGECSTHMGDLSFSGLRIDV